MQLRRHVPPQLHLRAAPAADSEQTIAFVRSSFTKLSTARSRAAAVWSPRIETLRMSRQASAGHGSVSGRCAAWQERAFELAWIREALGLADAEPR
ncbi:hypothetical protein [Amnibacterium endophyticum]|uniref:Uncharacterized protein n=1 Tax=Amnibacterium endophyticum TaxID=2109337 RepID=A0ABW4LIK9_9MICO